MGKARTGKERKGKERKGKERKGKARQARPQSSAARLGVLGRRVVLGADRAQRALHHLGRTKPSSSTAAGRLPAQLDAAQPNAVPHPGSHWPPFQRVRRRTADGAARPALQRELPGQNLAQTSRPVWARPGPASRQQASSRPPALTSDLPLPLSPRTSMELLCPRSMVFSAPGRDRQGGAGRVGTTAAHSPAGSGSEACRPASRPVIQRRAALAMVCRGPCLATAPPLPCRPSLWSSLESERVRAPAHPGWRPAGRAPPEAAGAAPRRRPPGRAGRAAEP